MCPDMSDPARLDLSKTGVTDVFGDEAAMLLKEKSIAKRKILKNFIVLFGFEF